MCCLGREQSQGHYFRMEKQTRMPPVVKLVMVLYEAALSDYLLFSYFARAMGTQK